MDIEIEKLNESYVRVKDIEEESIYAQLYNRYSEFIEGYQFLPAFKNHFIDGKIHLFSRNGVLPIGLAPDCIEFLKTQGYTPKLINFADDEFLEELDEDWYKNTIANNLKTKGMELRDYQDEAVRKALTRKKGILLSCTSSGKSMMIYNILRCLLNKGLKKALLIVPNTTLVEQMYNDFADYGYESLAEEVEQLYADKKPTYKKPILISTWQSLQTKEKEFFEDFDCVIVDECQGSKAKVIKYILTSCINAKYKIGTTGTLPTAKADLLTITSVLGRVIFELKSRDLISRGVLTKLTIANIILKYPLEFIKNNRDRSYADEVRMVEEYEGRNKALKTIFDHVNPQHNSLVLVNHISHLKQVKKWFEANYPNRKVVIVDGSIKTSEREDIRVSIESENGTIILATYGTMSTGINIPKLHEVILFANSKSKIKVLQSIGRGLRKHKDKKDIILFDVVDNLCYEYRSGRVKENYLYKHWLERMKYYEGEGFPSKSLEISL